MTTNGTCNGDDFASAGLRLSLVVIQSTIYVGLVAYTLCRYSNRLHGANQCLVISWLCETVFLLYRAYLEYTGSEFVLLPDLVWHLLTAANSVVFNWILFRLK